MSVTAPRVLPNNLLSAADSDFESGSTTWAADTNAGAPAASSSAALSGTKSLRWTATAAGDTAVSSGFIPCTFGLGYTASGYIAPGAARTVKIGLRWFNSAGTLLSTNFGTAVAASSGVFAPVVVASTPPSSSAVKFKVVAYVVGAGIGEAEFLDLAYAAQPEAQVLVDWVNPAFGQAATGGNAFTDITMWVRFDQGISITRGRQDSQSDVQTGTMSIPVQNDSGWFTPKNAGSPYYPNVTNAKRVQINKPDQVGTWHTRFDGAISEPDYAVDETGQTNLCTFTVSDALWPLNRQKSLFCWTKNQILAEPSLLYHWSLNDDGIAGLAAESSGNAGPPLRLKQWSTSGQVTWQGGSGGVETLADSVSVGGKLVTLSPFTAPLPSINLSPAITTASSFNDFVHVKGYDLQVRLPAALQTNTSSANWSIEAWFMMDPSLAAHGNTQTGPFTVLSLGDSTTGYSVVAGLFNQPAGFVAQVSAFSQPPSFIGTSWGGVATILAGFDAAFTTDILGVPHHLVITIAGASGGGTLSAYFDGVNIGSFTLSKKRQFDWLVVGGAYGGYGVWDGNISLVSIYNSVLSSADVSSHLATGQIANFGMPVDTAINTLANYTNLPPYWNGLTTGDALSLSDYMDTTGSNALTSMQTLEQSDNGLLFVNAAGQLTYHSRDWRMGYGAADVTLPTDTYTPDLGYVLTDQFQVNTAAFGSQIFPTGATAINDSSVAEFGDYLDGDPQSPNSIPVPTFAVGYATMGINEYAYWVDPYLTDISNWNANSQALPQLKCLSATVDLLTLDPTSGLTISQLLALDIDRMITLAGLPGSMATDTFANDFFIEGVTETIAQQSWTLQFFTSPAVGQRAWAPGDATYGVLGSTAVIGISESSTHAVAPNSKINDWEPGPPYWPPAFAVGMNNPTANGHDFIGENDIRGLTWNLGQLLSPVQCVVGQVNNAQTIPTSTIRAIAWDTVFVDTIGGMGFNQSWPNWYVCLQPGYYDIDASIIWSTTSIAFTVRANIVVAEKAAQAVMLGTGDPTTVNQASNIKSQVAVNNSSKNNVCAVSQQIYLGLGDMVSVQVWQDSGGNFNTGTNYNGSIMSLRWIGPSTVSDQWT